MRLRRSNSRRFGFVLLGFVLVRCCQRWAGKGVGFSPCAALGLLAVYVYLKQFTCVASLPALPFTYTSVGLSYVLFRVIHLMVDAHAGALERVLSPLAYVNYTRSFLSFVSGPIQRYQDFEVDLLGVDGGTQPSRDVPSARRAARQESTRAGARSGPYVVGGVIGDDGLAGIVIAQGDATGEAHLSGQRTALRSSALRSGAPRGWRYAVESGRAQSA